MKISNLIMYIFIVMLCLANVSCAPRTQMPKIKAEYYPQCVTPFKQLAEHEKRLRNRTIGYTAGGAAAGAAVGALTGLVSGNWRGAIAGGIIGAIAGAATGYNIAKVEAIKDDNKRLWAYRDVMTADLVNASDLELTALQSLRCYINEFETLEKNYAANIITKDDFAKRYAEIKNGINELGKVTGSSQALIAERDIELRASLEKESLKRGTAASFPTVQQRREERLRMERNKKSSQHRTRHSTKKYNGGKTIVPEYSSSLALSSIKSDLDSLSNDINADKIKYQKILPEQQNQQNNKTSVNAASSNKTMTMQDISVAYNEYPNKVLQMEKVEDQRKLTIQIMNDAVAKNGIDMI